ncbi:hypothetical protein Nepgr_034010, partial [Nepenthes gracilis]
QEKPLTQVSVDICSNPSPSSKHSGDKNRFLLPEFDNLVKEFNMDAAITVTSPMKEVETPKSNEETPKTTKSIDRYEYEQEIQNLKITVGILRERERHLEIKLLEYYGLNEQETAVMELQNRLKINILQADNRRLEAQVSDYSKVVAELEAAKAKIKLLWKKLRSEAEENKEQMLNLKQRVAELQEHDHDRDIDIESRLQRANELEVQNDELRKSNFDLRLENSELARRLESTQILATSFLDDQETEELRKEVSQLRQENKNLAKEIERLQSDRCADVEEVLRNYQPAPGKTIARDLSKSLSPRSEEKAKQLILEYANTEEGAGQRGITTVDFDSDQWSSSASNATDSPDNSTSDLTPATNKTHTLSKTKFLGKLRRLMRGHHHHHDHHETPYSPIGNAETGDAERSSDARSLGNRTSSQNSNKSSTVLGRLGSLNEEDTKESGSVRRSSESGSSHGYRRFVLGMESADKDSDGTRVSELVKYAEVLRGSHRRAASCGPW